MSAVCPKCGGETWDNRGNKKHPRAPDYKCKETNCGGAIWLTPKPSEFQQVKKVMAEPVVVTHAAPRPGLDERQLAIIRQHSQSMAVEVLKLKVTLNELTVEDLTPSKIRLLSDYFDEDVKGAAGVSIE